MANHRVSGHLVPDAVSGHLALEIANTRAGWGEEKQREYLVSYDALAVWAGDAGLLSSYETRQVRALGVGSPREARRVLDETIAFRESWYAVATSPWNERPFARARPRRRRRCRGSARPTSPSSCRSTTVASFPTVARSGRPGCGSRSTGPRSRRARCCASGDVAHVGQCAGHGCGWLFFDPSHRRHWCIMAICGNRAKARAFSERRRAERALGLTCVVPAAGLP